MCYHVTSVRAALSFDWFATSDVTGASHFIKHIIKLKDRRGRYWEMRIREGGWEGEGLARYIKRDRTHVCRFFRSRHPLGLHAEAY